MPQLPSGHLCSPSLVSSLLTAHQSVPWGSWWWRRRLRLVCSGYFAFAVPGFVLSGSGVGSSTGCSPLRAVPSVLSQPLLRQLLWAGVWLGRLLVCLLFPASLLPRHLFCLGAPRALRRRLVGASASPFCSISPALLGQLLFSQWLLPVVALAEAPCALWWAQFACCGASWDRLWLAGAVPDRVPHRSPAAGTDTCQRFSPVQCVTERRSV